MPLLPTITNSAMSLPISRPSSPSDPIIDRIEENRRTIYALKKENAELTAQYVKAHASKKEVIAKAIDKIKAYLEKHYTVDPTFIDLLRANITMAPMTCSLFRTTKYNTRVTYHTVLYEWQGQRIMYIRADANHDNYYKDCDHFNGFEIDPTEFDVGGDERYTIWWKTDDDAYPNASVEHAVEKAINTTRSSKNFNDYIVGIPDMYKIIVAIFDLTERVPYLICDDVLPKDYEFIP